MLRIGFVSLAAILASLQALAAAVPAPIAFAKPFWEGKPALEIKLREERAVLVSVRTDKGELDKTADLFTINGIGYVKRDAETVYQLAKQFDHLKEISDVFREVKYDAKTSRVFVICEALGYQARMLIHIDSSKEPIREIRFKVVEGHFLGLEGVLGVKELPLAAVSSAALTEVSFRVLHEAREIPIPRVLVGFALEVLIQKVAVKMRSHFEEALPKATPANAASLPAAEAQMPTGAWQQAPLKAQPKKSIPKKSAL